MLMLQNVWNFFWNPVTDVVWIVDDIVKPIPYPLLFLIGILVTQGLFTIDASFKIGAAAGVRQLLHGTFLDLAGVLWTLGVACGLVAWAAASKALDALSERRNRRHG